MVKWNCTAKQDAIVYEIAGRADRELGLQDRTETAMDIEATHSNGCPLRLQELLTASPFDFAHDIYGIRKNLNRETGKIENLFSPRFSK